MYGVDCNFAFQQCDVLKLQLQMMDVVQLWMTEKKTELLIELF